MILLDGMPPILDMYRLANFKEVLGFPKKKKMAIS